MTQRSGDNGEISQWNREWFPLLKFAAGILAMKFYSIPWNGVSYVCGWS